MKSVSLLTEFEENLSVGYPHTNSFLNGGRSMILGCLTATEASLWKLDLASTHRRKLCEFARERQPDRYLWSDVAQKTNRLVTVADNAVWILDPYSDAAPQLLRRAPDGYQIHPIPGIRADGLKIITALSASDCYRAWELDAETGNEKVLFEKAWWLNHVHYSPFDSEWIGFSHEGFCTKVMDRVWGWHPQYAPDGACFFNQMPNDSERPLYAGHERWSFHDRSVLAIAYGDSPGRPRGVYESFVDGRPQRLISEGDRDMHLDVSRDGRWVVVDTSGAHDLPGKGWENADCISDILFIDRQSGERRFAARSSITKHPSHPHPVFSPDGSRVYFNEGERDGTRNRVWWALNPFVV